MADSTKKPRNYIKGSAKKIQFSNGSHVIHIDLKVEDLQKLPVNSAGYVKITISELKEKDKFGNEYSIFENDFIPDKTKAKASSTKSIKNDRKEQDTTPPWAR